MGTTVLGPAERGVLTASAEAPAAPHAPDRENRLPEASDDLAAALGKRFIERRDVKAIQSRSGAYSPVLDIEKKREKFTMRDLRAHLDGARTFGHYLVSPEGNCRVFAFDIDLNKAGKYFDDNGDIHDINPREAWLGTSVGETHPAKKELTITLRCLGEALLLRTHALLEMPVALAYSGGKGVHVYAFLGSMPAADARVIAREVLDSYTDEFRAIRGDSFFEHATSYRNVSLELFPKQDDLEGKDLGNLMRLPLGVNRKTGQRGFFIDVNQGYDKMVPDDAALVLAHGSVR